MPRKRRMHRLSRIVHKLTSLEIILVATLFTIIYLFSPSVSPVRRRVRVQSIDENALDVWKRYVKEFPVQPRDRYAFKEMGFRTYMYAELLRKGSDLDVAGLEESLWHFIPAISKLRKQLRLEIQSNKLVPFKAYDPSTNRGIITAIDETRLEDTIELVSTLRNVVNCTLPMEVFYRGEANVPMEFLDIMKSFSSVKVINLDDTNIFDEDFLGHEDVVVKPESAMQSVAMIASSFAQAIFIEPGTICFTNPAQLFLDNHFEETGTLFFHERNLAQQADSTRFLNYLRQQLDHSKPSDTLATSAFYNYGSDSHQNPSVVVLDRTKPGVFAALLLNVWLHSSAVRHQVWHAHFIETTSQSIWLSFEMANIPYAFMPSFPGAIGHYKGSIDDIPWNPFICPAHPLYFESNSYSKIGRKAIFASGSLKTSPQIQEYFNVTAYTSRGRWQETDGGICIFDATPNSVDDSLKNILKAHRSVDEAFQERFRRRLK